MKTAEEILAEIDAEEIMDSWVYQQVIQRMKKYAFQVAQSLLYDATEKAIMFAEVSQEDLVRDSMSKIEIVTP